MNQTTTQSVAPDEPMGIVISGGAMHEPAPVFRAYVWGSAPEQPRERQATPVAA